MSQRMPAEWEPHEATWLAWPHEKSDWLDAFPKVKHAYRAIVAALTPHERVEILCARQEVLDEAQQCLAGIENVHLHLVPNDRSWVRDSGPTCVITSDNQVAWVRWQFNAWAKYDNFSRDVEVAASIIEISGLPASDGLLTKSSRLVIEGGAIDSDGQGGLLVTEECLLSDVQNRNPGISREDYERVFAKYLGVTNCVWLGKGVSGDDTHGHIDGVCRFVAPGRLVLCAPQQGDAEFLSIYNDNVQRLKEQYQGIEIIDLPLPANRYYQEQRLPASYANFYIANEVVLVPVFDDSNDKVALDIMKSAFPSREVIGIYCGDLIVGLGAIHCITQPQFAPQ